MRLAITLGVMVCCSGLAQAEIYKCIDTAGKVTFQDAACPGSRKDTVQPLKKDKAEGRAVVAKPTPTPRTPSWGTLVPKGEEQYLIFTSEGWKTETRAEIARIVSRDPVARRWVEDQATGGGQADRARDPTLGMSVADAENSAWGSPKTRNITQSAYGVREQWVYPNQGYLYFENGRLTSIQTTR